MTNKFYATCYLQVKGNRNPYSDKIDGAKIVRSTQTPPQITDPDVRLVKVKITIPAETFDPLSVVVDIPPEAIQTPVIEGISEVDSDE